MLMRVLLIFRWSVTGNANEIYTGHSLLQWRESRVSIDQRRWYSLMLFSCRQCIFLYEEVLSWYCFKTLSFAVALIVSAKRRDCIVTLTLHVVEDW